MNTPDVSRRELLIQGSATPLLHTPWLAQAFPSRQAKKSCHGWINRAPTPAAASSRTCSRGKTLLLPLSLPTDKFFRVSHYDKPVIDEKKWNLEVTGLVKKPMTLTLPAVKARPKQDVVYTIECGGNHGFPGSPAGSAPPNGAVRRSRHC